MSAPALVVPLPDAAATRALGERLARELLRPGDLVLLDGPLGAGKTTLAQGVGAGLGLADGVRSPTYTVVDFHPQARVPLVHVDAWRLRSAAELLDLDLDGLVPLQEAVVLVEWGVDRAEGLADAHLLVQLDRSGLDAGEDGRVARLTGWGREWPDRISAFGNGAVAP